MSAGALGGELSAAGSVIFFYQHSDEQDASLRVRVPAAIAYSDTLEFYPVMQVR